LACGCSTAAAMEPSRRHTAELCWLAEPPCSTTCQAVKNIEFLADPTVGEVRIGTHDPLIAGVLPHVFRSS
jgi:hypothetical protein